MSVFGLGIMTELEKRARLNEIGWELAAMYPKQRGNYIFGIVDGVYKGVKFEDNIPPGRRPSGTKSGGF